MAAKGAAAKIGADIGGPHHQNSENHPGQPVGQGPQAHEMAQQEAQVKHTCQG